MKTTMKVLATVAIVVASIATSKAQDTIKATAEIVSSYVWRGSIATGNNSPNIQPTLAYGHGPLEIGIWGSTDFVGGYKEFDPYIAYTINSMFKVTVTDYDWTFYTPTGTQIKYFDYKNSETGHMFEGTIGITNI